MKIKELTIKVIRKIKNTIIKAKFQRIKSVSIGKSPTFEGSMKIMVDVTSVIVIGNQLHMRGPLYLKALAGGKLEVGDTCFFNHNCSITCMKKVKIGSNCKFGNNLVIVDHDHNYKKKGDQHLLKSPVTIGKNVWIGSNVVILRGAVIGDNAVIAAGSVVRGTVPSHTVYYNKRTDEFIAYMQKEKLDGGN